MTVERPPFKMLSNRGAQTRYTWVDSKGVERQAIKSGRASYVWLHAVLIPLAIGQTNEVEIRRTPDGPWHKVTGCDEAYQQIMDHYKLMTAMKRMVRRRRQAKGMEA